MANGAAQQKLAGRLGRLAALPVRSAPARQRRGAAAPAITGTVQGKRRRTICATSRASAWSSAPIRRATKRFSPSPAGGRRAAMRRCITQLAGITVPAFRRAARPGNSWTGGRKVNLSTTLSRNAACRIRSIVGAGPLGDDLDIARALRRRRRDARAALAVRGGNHRRADGRLRQRRAHSPDSFAEAGQLRAEPLIALGPDECLEHLRSGRGRVRHSGDGVAQRHARRAAGSRYARTDRASRRRTASSCTSITPPAT